MTRQLTDEQLGRLNRDATRPVVLVSWAYPGEVELLSCGGDVVFDGEVYTPGIVTVRSIPNSRGASFSLSATRERIGDCLNGTWRGGICKVYALPGDAGQRAFTLGEEILLLDGTITAASFTAGSISVDAVHKNLDGNFTPRNIVEEVATDLAPPGSIIEWQGGELVLEGVRK